MHLNTLRSWIEWETKPVMPHPFLNSTFISCLILKYIYNCFRHIKRKGWIQKYFCIQYLCQTKIWKYLCFKHIQKHSCNIQKIEPWFTLKKFTISKLIYNSKHISYSYVIKFRKMKYLYFFESLWVAYGWN